MSAPPCPTESPISTTPTTLTTTKDSSSEANLTNTEDAFNITEQPILHRTTVVPSHEEITELILEMVPNPTESAQVESSTGESENEELVTEFIPGLGEEDEALILTTAAPAVVTIRTVSTTAPRLTATQREELIGHLAGVNLQSGEKTVLTPDQKLAVEQELEYRRVGLPPFDDPDTWQRLSRQEQTEFNRKFRELSEELQVFSSNQFNTLPDTFLEHAFNMFILLDIQTLSQVLYRELEETRAIQLQKHRVLQRQEEEQTRAQNLLQSSVQFVQQPSIQEQFQEQPRRLEQFQEQQSIQDQLHEQPRQLEQFQEQPTRQEQFQEQPRRLEKFQEQQTRQEQFQKQSRAQEQTRFSPQINEDNSMFQQKLINRKSIIDPRLRFQFDPRRRQPVQQQQQVQQQAQNQEQLFNPKTFEQFQQHFDSQPQHQLNSQPQQQFNSQPQQQLNFQSQQQFNSQPQQQFNSQPLQQFNSHSLQFFEKSLENQQQTQFQTQSGKKQVLQQESNEQLSPQEQHHLEEQERLIAAAVRLQNSLAFPEV